MARGDLSDAEWRIIELLLPTERGADGQGRPLGFALTGGETSDYSAVPALLAIPVGKPRSFLADKGYDGDAIREKLIHGVRPVIPPKANRKTRHPATLGHIKAATASSECSIDSSSSAGLPPVATKPAFPSKRSFHWGQQKSGCRTSRNVFSSPLALRRKSFRRLMKSVSLAHGF